MINPHICLHFVNKGSGTFGHKVRLYLYPGKGKGIMPYHRNCSEFILCPYLYAEANSLGTENKLGCFVNPVSLCLCRLSCTMSYDTAHVHNHSFLSLVFVSWIYRLLFATAIQLCILFVSYILFQYQTNSICVFCHFPYCIRIQYSIT